MQHSKMFNERLDVRNFLLQIDWQKDETHDGGITWLELHGLFRLHGGKMAKESQDVQPGEDPITLSRSIRDFKAAVRWIVSRGVAQEKEWLLKTSYSRLNRLAPLGISNKHAAIKGISQLSTKQAEAVAKEIYIAKGVMKNKKQTLAWEILF